MSINFRKLTSKFLIVGKSLYFYFLSFNLVIRHEFDRFARVRSFYLINLNSQVYMSWLCNPISIVRYFEFQFCHQSIDWGRIRYHLDISSPRLFFIYLIYKYPKLKVHAINPDKNDLNETKLIIKTLGLSDKVNIEEENALHLPYPDQYFEVITSISVIEHIPDDGDSKAILELWRALKPQGKLIITVPCMKKYHEEWRNADMYKLGYSEKNGRYFFQRFYDQAALKTRIIDVIKCEPSIMKFFGEKMAGTFFQYEQRWIQYGLWETVKDPWHIIRDYQSFSSIQDLPGVGICGLVFEKESVQNV